MTFRIKRREFLKLAATAAGASVFAGSADPAALAGTSGTARKPIVPGTFVDADRMRHSSAYLGVYCPLDRPGCSDPGGLESVLGRRFGVNHHFRSPPETEWAPLHARMQDDKARGRISMLSYAAGKEPGYPDDELGQQQAALARLVEIARGNRDAYIDGQAAALAALDAPVFLRFTWEFDLRYFGAAGGDAFRAAWRHVWTRFQRKRATNVAFVWCPTWLAFRNGAAERFYPGSGYVDWIAADGYSRAPDYRSFSALFTVPNMFAISHRKPFMVAETGVHRLGSQAACTSGCTKQSRWLDDVGQVLNAGRFANLKALVYFEADGNDEPLPNHWRVTVPSPGPALASFAQLAWNPRLKARGAQRPPMRTAIETAILARLQ